MATRFDGSVVEEQDESVGKVEFSAVNAQPGKTLPPECADAVRPPAFSRAIGDCGTSQAPITGSTGSTNDIEGRTREGTLCRYGKFLPTPHLSFDDAGETVCRARR